MKILVVIATACSTASSAPTPQATVASEHVPPTITQRVESSAANSHIGNDKLTTAIDDVHIVGSIAGGAASDRPIHARKDQPVTLFAVLRVGTTYYSDARELVLGHKRKSITPLPLAQAPAVALKWLRIEPTAANMSNTQSGKFRFEHISYNTTAIDTREGGSVVADVRPTLTPDHGSGVGTMRYQLRATQGTRTLETPGIAARRGRGAGGLADSVMRVSIRRDDSFLGFMTEMYGQPYVWASAGLSDATHQSERLEGSDCADLMIYGARRTGKRVAYTWTGGLPAITKLVVSGTRDGDGVYRDAKGKALPYTADGDLVLFPRHVGALAGDRGEKGVLDDQDLMLHTLFDSPKEQAIAASGYADKPVEVRRFR